MDLNLKAIGSTNGKKVECSVYKQLDHNKLSCNRNTEEKENPTKFRENGKNLRDMTKEPNNVFPH